MIHWLVKLTLLSVILFLGMGPRDFPIIWPLDLLFRKIPGTLQYTQFKIKHEIFSLFTLTSWDFETAKLQKMMKKVTRWNSRHGCLPSHLRWSIFCPYIVFNNHCYERKSKLNISLK